MGSRVFAPTTQLLLSATIGLCVAICCLLVVGLTLVAASASAPEWLAPAGWCCVLPAVLCLGGYVSGQLTRKILGDSRGLAKSLVATPASYIILLASAILTIAYPEELRDREFYVPAVTFVLPVLLASSWLFTFLGFRFARRKPIPGGEPHCEQCDYLLIGLTEPRCPECGTPFDPSLLGADGKSRAVRSNGSLSVGIACGALLIVSGCAFDATTRVTDGTSAGNELGTNRTDRQHPRQGTLRKPLERAEAFELAYVYAFEKQLVLWPVEAQALQQPDTSWRVAFSYRVVTDSKGLVLNLDVDGNVVVLVLPDGSCRELIYNGVRDGSSALPEDMIQAARLREPEGTIVDERLAVLLAKSFAMRHGLIRTEMMVEDCLATDGTWLFLFTPCMELPRTPEETIRVRKLPFTVAVSPSGQCTAFPHRAVDSKILGLGEE